MNKNLHHKLNNINLYQLKIIYNKLSVEKKCASKAMINKKF